MAMKIRASECTDCRRCCDVCPMDAAHPSRDATACWIDPARCTECVGHYAAPRCFEICPARCVETDPDRLEDRETLLRRWHALELTGGDA